MSEFNRAPVPSDATICFPAAASHDHQRRIVGLGVKNVK
jgi:hypothetical protein